LGSIYRYVRLRARGGRFLKKAPQKLFLWGSRFLPKLSKFYVRLPPNPSGERYQSHFRGILFAREKNTLGPRHIQEKESSLSFSRMCLGLAEKQKLLRQK